MKNVLAVMASFATLAATPAHAALTVNLSLPSGTFSNASVFCAEGTGAPCSFTDTVTFSTPSPLNRVSASIATIAVGGRGSVSDINFTSVTLDGVAFTMTQLFGGVFEVGGLNSLSFIAPGTHTLIVSGTTYGSDVGLDGSYSGTLRFATNVVSPSAIPEPAAWLLLAAGFGALGSTMRRRGSKPLRVNFLLT